MEPFVITRILDAPPEEVFRTWTEPGRIERWWGPKGCAARVRKLELRPGGVFHYSMQTPDGPALWGKWIFREVAAPHRLVFTNSFADEACNIARHPFAPDWPLETLTTIEFAGRGAGTALTITWAPLNPTEAEARAFDGGRDSMQKGWTGTLDQLSDYLNQQPKEKPCR